MAKPTKVPSWALIPQNDPITGAPNIEEPPNEEKNSGWKRAQKPPHNWFNWLLNLTGQWLKYLNDEFIPNTESKIGVLEERGTGEKYPFVIRTAVNDEVFTYGEIEVIEYPRFVLFLLDSFYGGGITTLESKAILSFTGDLPTSILDKIPLNASGGLPIGSIDSERGVANVIFDKGNSTFNIKAKDTVFRTNTQSIFPTSFMLVKS